MEGQIEQVKIKAKFIGINSSDEDEYTINAASLYNHSIRPYTPILFQPNGTAELYLLDKDESLYEKAVTGVVINRIDSKLTVTDLITYMIKMLQLEASDDEPIKSLMLQVVQIVDEKSGKTKTNLVYIPSLKSTESGNEYKAYKISGRQLLPLLVRNLAKACENGNYEAASRLQEKIDHIENILPQSE